MTRFAASEDITNFLQRNQYADQIGAMGMSAYADQTKSAAEQDAHVAMGGIQASHIAEEGRLARKFGRQIASQNRGSFLTNAAIDGFGNILGGAIRGGHFGGYGGTGSTGGVGDTFRVGDVSKYGDVVQNPMDSFRAAGITGPIGMY